MPTGHQDIDEGKTYPPISTRAPLQAPSDSDSGHDLGTGSESPEDDALRDGSLSSNTRMNEESESDEDELTSSATSQTQVSHVGFLIPSLVAPRCIFLTGD